MPRSRLASYLGREALSTSLMTLAVLVSITLALFLGELLGDVAEGRALLSTLLMLLVLRIPEALVLTAPLALVVGLLMAFGELAQNREFSVIRAAGARPARIFASVLAVALAWSLALVAVTGWVAPWSAQRSAAMAERMADDLLVARIQPGRFESLAGGRLNVHVRGADTDRGRLTGVFVHFVREGRVEVISAASGRLYRRAEDGRRVLALSDGVHVGHAEGGSLLPMRRIAFERNIIELPLSESGDRDPIREVTAAGLARLDSPAAWTELQRRLMPALMSVVLALFALPITTSAAPGRRFAVVLVAIVAYLVYANSANLMLARLPDGLAAWPGIWPLHGAALLATLVPVAAWWRRW